VNCPERSVFQRCLQNAAELVWYIQELPGWSECGSLRVPMRVEMKMEMRLYFPV
jgi:hypothetical protein